MENKIRALSKRESDKLGSLPYKLWTGYCAYIFDLAGVPRINPIPEEYFDAVIYGIVESFYGGCEPEFESDEEGYNRYQDAVKRVKSMKWINPKDVVGGRNRSPYQNKSLPYLG